MGKRNFAALAEDRDRDYPRLPVRGSGSTWSCVIAVSFVPVLLTAICLLCLGPLASGAGAADVPASLLPAQRALLDGRADEASTLLRNILAANPTSGRAHLLLCRVYVSEGFGSQAAGECQAALNNGLANESEAQDWTGRALGQQASHAGMISGMRLALGVRNAFEDAVRLAPASEPACVDLGEYYTAAPAIVGGGNAKALALAASIEHTLPEIAHRIRAMAAEKNEDLGTAEREFTAEAAIARRPGALVDLAAFYGRHGQDSKAIGAAEQTIAADRSVDATVVEAAGVLADAGKPAAAASSLRAYIIQGQHTDQAPVFRAYTQLGDLLAKQGQRDSARAAYIAALSLASLYPPARKGLAAL